MSTLSAVSTSDMPAVNRAGKTMMDQIGIPRDASAAEAARGMPIWSIMVFPALFTAGMSLVDTADNVLMVGAYGWAFLNPIRKIWYNLTITAISALVAMIIGGIEALGLIVSKLELAGSFWKFVEKLNGGLAGFGYVVVGIFIASWIVSYLIYRWSGVGRIVVERA